MPEPTSWHPVVAAHELRAGQNIVSAMVRGQELALWRSDQGEPQAWENRCPHRGVRLTLGRLQNGRLACGYHGWEYAAGSGRCEVIPALPDIAVPGKVCVKTYRAIEARAMIWVRLDADAAHGRTPSAQAVPPGPSPVAPGLFCRSLAIRAALEPVQAVLAKNGFAHQAPAVWRGRLAGLPVIAYTLCVDTALSMLHLWWAAPDGDTPPAALFAAARRLRADVEAALA